MLALHKESDLLAIPGILTLLQNVTAGFAATRPQQKQPSARRPAPARPHKPAKLINLALQGGGAHGAFTWGVLDLLLEDGRLGIAGISGTSAGAINAVMLADGLARGGPDEARARLADFWRAASRDGSLSGPQRAALDRMLSFMPGTAPMQALVGNLSRFLSPYDLNPLNVNPLKDLIERSVDFDAIHASPAPSLFISATNVHTGDARVFTHQEITADVVMASAALPTMFRAVEIDGVPYWDGGYSGNPAIVPLLCANESPDVLVIQITPIEREATPNSAREIVNRISEITFNASLTAELKMIGLIGKLIDEGRLKPGPGYTPTKLHRIALDGGPRLTATSQLNTDYKFFETLHRAGRRAARRFLDAHFDDIGVRGTLDAEKAAA